MTVSQFGSTAKGEPVHRITLANSQLTVDLLTHGARIQNVRLPGLPWALTAGSDDLGAYDGGPFGYFGALVGPVAGRLAGARAPVGDTTLTWPANNGPNLLHGGDPENGGFHEQIWRIESTASDRVVLQLDRRPEDDGFPGTRRHTAIFELTGTALRLTLDVTSTAQTLLNFANHSYWTLDGPDGTDEVVLKLAAQEYLPIREDVTPIAPPRPVSGTLFDFTEATTLPKAGSLDHCFCLSARPEPLRPVLWLQGRHGAALTIATTEPGLVVFDGAGLDNQGFCGHDGMNYTPNTALALEPQHWTDAPNMTEAASIEYGPQRAYRQVTEWRFAGPA